MCRHVEAHFPPDVRAIRSARRLVAGQLDAWELDDTDGVTVLLVSELMTNAVMHARTTVDLVMAVADGVVEVAVGDGDGSGVAELRGKERFRAVASEWQAEHGRGLFLVDALATEWGIEPLEGGKHVWFRRPVTEGWKYVTDCPCHGDDLHDAVVLASGRRVKLHASG